jgi:regulator of replication initiation timing
MRIGMRNQSERLQAAMAARGVKTAAALARLADRAEQEPGVRHHVNGTRGFDLDTARVYARALKIDPIWLFSGEGDMEPKAKRGLAVKALGDLFFGPYRFWGSTEDAAPSDIRKIEEAAFEVFKNIEILLEENKALLEENKALHERLLRALDDHQLALPTVTKPAKSAPAKAQQDSDPAQSTQFYPAGHAAQAGKRS